VAGCLKYFAMKYLELYTLRVQLPKDFAKTIEAVGKMGYQGVKFAGYHGADGKPNELRRPYRRASLKQRGYCPH